MKIKTVLIAVLVVALTSCSSQHDSKSEHLVFSSSDTASSAKLPYLETFESYSIEYAVQDCNPGFKWQINNENGNSFLECICYIEDEVTEGNNIFGLLMGDISWKDYSFSFDVKLKDNSFITFAPYADNNMDSNTEYEYFDGRNPWALQINSNGELIYQTLFEQGTHFITKNPEVLAGFLVDEWNHVELFPQDKKLIMVVNGVEIGEVADLQEHNSGRISIGGSVGCMYDNIRVEYVEEVSTQIYQ